MIDETADAQDPLANAAIEAGDAAAGRGDWVLAVSVWERLLETPDQPAARQRIRWFLAEAEGYPPNRSNRRRALAAGVAFAIVGTACVFLGQAQTGVTRNVLSAIAWLLYIASAAMAVTFAFTSAASPTRASDVTADDLHLARATAARLQSNHGHEDSDHET